VFLIFSLKHIETEIIQIGVPSGYLTVRHGKSIHFIAKPGKNHSISIGAMASMANC
jgi:hypothetical protein